MLNIDRLYEAVAARGHVCVGLDTLPDYIPNGQRRLAASDAEAVLAYNRAFVDATLDIAACYKVQIAFYESMGISGFQIYSKTLQYIHQKKGLAIADIKRGDIADTAVHYAKAHFEGEFEADFVTLSPLMGMDSIEPWFSYAKDKGKGAFILVRTSNKGMRDFEYLELKENSGPGISGQGQTAGSPSDISHRAGRSHYRFYHAIGDKLMELADVCRGNCGYGAFGAVVGCTEREEAAEIRSMYPDLFFLIPGYGTQGGAADDAVLFLREGNGGVVNASRSILRAWSTELKNSGKNSGGDDVIDAAFAAEAGRRAAIEMRDAIRKAVTEKQAAAAAAPEGNIG